MNVVFTVCPALVTFTTFATYVALDPVNNILTAEKAFACIAIIAILRGPMFMFPHAVVGAIRLSVSVRRINEYLNCEDSRKDKDIEMFCHSEENEFEFEKANLSWADKNTLRDIDLNVKKGSLVAIIGTVGSGKSSLLSALLGEMTLSSGKLRAASQEVSYVPQQAWVQNLTLRDNILFGNEMEDKKYWNIVDACAMTEDLELFPARDLTEIGDHGINLSGGQKQRVSLARAAYADAQLVLLDDPLSAVDAHVAEHIFTNLIGPKGLMASKTRVLATHNLTYISKVDKIVLLKDGCISAIGSYTELSSTNAEFQEYVKTASLQTDDTKEEDFDFSQKRKKKKLDIQEKDGRVTKDEKSSDARVDFKHFLYYFRNMGYVSVLGISLFLVTSQTLNTLMTYVLGLWTEEEQENNQGDNSNYLMVLATIMLSLTIFDYLKEYLLNYRCAVASEHIHKDSLEGVLMSPLSFFDANPVGRILNRFSQDLFILDMHFPGQLSGCAAIIPMWVWSVITVGLFFPSLVIGILALVAIAALMQVGFARTKRQLKRMEAITRSPLYAHFTETVSGSTIVRAFNSKERFIRENCQHLSKNLDRGYVLFISDKWLGVRIEMMNNLVILMTSLAMVYYRGSIAPGIAAFILTNVFTSTEFIGLGVYLFSETETDSISLERLREYSELDRENNYTSKNSNKFEVDIGHSDDNWPKTGHISMTDYSTKYLNSHDDVLKKINLHIKDGERLGICGRTGAGKSSLTLSLLRIVEDTFGRIELDGKNIASANLKRLRTAVTIIPQDPVLFSGSLRSNVDPTDKLSDSEVWKALEISKLTDWIKSLEGGIEHEVEAGGSNFSAGQRQQICLARALARREQTRVLVLDEATSAVDHVTDANIQEAIAEGFPGCTILTVAHRLNTIKNSSDRVLVLSHGQVVENSCPKQLMADETSAFYRMCKDAGVL